MELWIRSQNRETLLKVEKIKKYDVYSQKVEKQNYMPRNATSYDDMQQVTAYVDDKYLRTIIVANDVEVAEYKTKERALEVLDEIEERISLLNTMCLVHDYNSLISFKKAIGEDKITGLCYPYQMPKE